MINLVQQEFIIMEIVQNTTLTVMETATKTVLGSITAVNLLILCIKWEAINPNAVIVNIVHIDIKTVMIDVQHVMGVAIVNVTHVIVDIGIGLRQIGKLTIPVRHTVPELTMI